jgi:serine/threonine protein kinase
MHNHLAGQSDFQRRFQLEAQAAARLDHPSIVRVYQFGRQRGWIYIVMELIEGLSLGAYIRQLARLNQVVKLEETLTLMAQVADALGYAHRHGVVHRDIKPGNILVKRLDWAERPGEPPLRAVVTDFGLAKLREGDLDTQTGQLMGTLSYMAPEQVLDLPVDGRADIYSLGVVLYQLATGRLPLELRTPSEAYRKHSYEEVPLPRTVHPGVPAAVEQVIMRALARRPENRYQTGEELATALRRAAGTLTDQDTASFEADAPSTVVSMIMEIPTPVSPLVWDIRPEELPNPGVCRVLLRNNMPSAVTLAVAAEVDQQSLTALRFDTPEKRVTLVPGQKGLVDFYIQAARRPFTGLNRKHRFAIRVTPLTESSRLTATGSSKVREGVLNVRPHLPLWLFLSLIGLAAGACWLVVSVYNVLGSFLNTFGLPQLPF